MLLTGGLTSSRTASKHWRGLRVWAIRREDLTEYPVLFWPVGVYLIIYRAERRPVEIVAVTQGSRDIPSFLRRRVRN